jgi:putative RecB family exonuclease
MTTHEPFRNAHSRSFSGSVASSSARSATGCTTSRSAKPSPASRSASASWSTPSSSGSSSEVLDDERTGPLSEERALEVYREAWTAEGLTGVDVFQEGLKILRDFVREQGVVDHRDVLAVEKEFRLPVGPFTVLGFIDRVDWVDDETVEVIDYKTNRQLFTRDEVDTSPAAEPLPRRRAAPLAVGEEGEAHVLDAAARHPPADDAHRGAARRRARLRRDARTADRDRDGVPGSPQRQLLLLRPPPALPGLRRRAQAGKREFLCEDLADLEAVAREREEVARLAKALYARKEELEDILKAHLKEQDELVLGGVRYRMFNDDQPRLPARADAHAARRRDRAHRDELLAKLGAIDKKALDALLKSLGKKLDKPRVSLLKAELEAHADKTHSPRFWAKEVA